MTLIGSPGSHVLGGAVGLAYVYQGEWTKWSQQQILSPGDRRHNSYGSDFGSSVSIDDNFALIGAPADDDSGASGGTVHAFISYPPLGRWSLQQALHPRDAFAQQGFGSSVSLMDGIAAIGAPGICSCPQYQGAVYVFAVDSCSGLWSQQQKLTADTTGNRFGGVLSTYDKYIVVGVANEDVTINSVTQTDAGAVYVFKPRSNGKYTLQQKLLQPGGTQDDNFGNSLSMYGSSLQVSGAFSSSNNGLIFVFAFDGSLWTNQQVLSAPPSYGIGQHFSNPHIHGVNAFASDDLWHGFHFSAETNWSCLVISVSDHFGDGWGQAKLVVSAPDGTRDSYAPYCTSRNPFVFRYCPLLPSDTGTYTLSIPGATESPFYWEMYWTVHDEKSGAKYIGDHATELNFNFDSDFLAFNYLSSHHLRVNGTCHVCPGKSPPKPKPKPLPSAPVTQPHPPPPPPAPLDNCRVARRSSPAPVVEKKVSVESQVPNDPAPAPPQPLTAPKIFRSLQQTPTAVPTQWPTLNSSEMGDWHWLHLQDSLANGWFEADGTGTSYYISDPEGKELVSSGTLCGDMFSYQCWQPLWDGTYVLRIGGALDEEADNHIWSFCGKTGGAQQQLLFKVHQGVCTPIVSFSKNQYCSQNEIRHRFRGHMLLRGMDNDTELTTSDRLLLDQVIASLTTVLKASDVDIDEVSFSGAMDGQLVSFSLTVSSALGFDGRDYDSLESLYELLTSSFQHGFQSNHFLTSLAVASDTSTTDSGKLLDVKSVQLLDLSFDSVDFSTTKKTSTCSSCCRCECVYVSDLPRHFPDTHDLLGFSE